VISGSIFSRAALAFSFLMTSLIGVFSTERPPEAGADAWAGAAGACWASAGAAASYARAASAAAVANFIVVSFPDGVSGLDEPSLSPIYTVQASELRDTLPLRAVAD
jgi:hypothetical protein